MFVLIEDNIGNVVKEISNLLPVIQNPSIFVYKKNITPVEVDCLRTGNYFLMMSIRDSDGNQSQAKILLTLE